MYISTSAGARIIRIIFFCSPFEIDAIVKDSKFRVIHRGRVLFIDPGRRSVNRNRFEMSFFENFGEHKSRTKMPRQQVGALEQTSRRVQQVYHICARRGYSCSNNSARWIFFFFFFFLRVAHE